MEVVSNIKMSASKTIPPLRGRVLRAGGWILGGHFLAQLIRLGGNLILTRLLVPEMFGLMAIVYVLMIGISLFSDVGLGQNIIQSRRGEDPLFLNTAWVAQIVRGALIYLLALLMSASLYFMATKGWLPVASVYADPLLPFVIAVFASTALIGGFESTKLAVARRRLAVAPNIRIEIISQVVSLVVMLVWAVLQRSIWALVAGAIISGIVKAILSHVMLPGPSNHWAWDAAAFKEIIGFGKWVFLSSIFGFLVINGDRLLLGGLVDAKQLGLYSIAFLIVNTLQVVFTQLTSGVAFPALSEVARETPTQLKATYYKFRLPVDIAMLFCAGVLFTFGSTIIHLLYDSRYFAAGPILEILACGIIAARYQLVEQCYLALGKPGAQTLINTMRLFALYVLVPGAFWLYQFKGAVWAIALNPFMSLPVIFFFKTKYQLLDIKKELLVLPILLLGAGAGKLLEFVFMFLLGR